MLTTTGRQPAAGKMLLILLSMVAGSGEFHQTAIAQEQLPQSNRSVQTRFDEWDTNGDGYVSRNEFPTRLPKSRFDEVDKDGDGRISRIEDANYRNRNGRTTRDQSRTETGAANVPPGTRLYRDLVYAVVGERQLPLDLYVPAATEEPVPLLIWIHGGGWRNGSKSRSRALPLVGHGYAVASVEYRLSGEAIFPAAIEDCKAAVSFLRFHAARYGIDPTRFGAWGSSAGGHLVALLAATNDVKDFDTHAICQKAPATIQAVCDWFGPTDFLRMNDFEGRIDHDSATSPESRFIGGPIQQNVTLCKKANPITYVTKNHPPILIMHGDLDLAVPYNQSELLFAALREAGIDSQLYKVVNGGHGFRNSVDSSEKLRQMVIDFFDKHLKP